MNNIKILPPFTLSEAKKQRLSLCVCEGSFGMVELWKTVKDFPKYECSNTGRIKNKQSGRILKPCPKYSRGEWGYLHVSMMTNDNKKSKRQFVHRVFAKTWIPNPDNKPCVNHIDGNKQNNALSNLEWSTWSENNKHAFDTGLKYTKSGKDSPSARHCVQISLDGFLLNSFDSIIEASKHTELCPKRISDCVNNKIKPVGNFIWK